MDRHRPGPVRQHRAALGPSLAQYDVKLYGPDTASAANALAVRRSAARGPGRATVVRRHRHARVLHRQRASRSLSLTVHADRSDLPVYVTEYTSFQYGALDRGQEATTRSVMLDSLQVYASLMNAGADAALYWDAVDYYQAGHAAVTRWGLSRKARRGVRTEDALLGIPPDFAVRAGRRRDSAASLNGPRSPGRAGSWRWLPPTRRSDGRGDQRAGPIQLTITSTDRRPRSSSTSGSPTPTTKFEHIGRVRVANGTARSRCPPVR